MTREELIEKKTLGCSKCCEIFPWEIRNSLLEIQGCAQFNGIVPEKEEVHEHREKNLDDLYDEESEKMFEKTISDEDADTENKEILEADISAEEDEEPTEFDRDMQKFIELSSALRVAVAEEDYEKAAEIRDEMKALSVRKEETEG